MTPEDRQFLELHLNPYIEHEDYTKCGICWKEKIGAEVAKEMLDSGVGSIKGWCNQTDKRWRETSLFKRVRSMMHNDGHKLEEIEKILAEEGIAI